MTGGAGLPNRNREEEDVSEITKVGVVGGGLMGRGIAQVCAAAGT